MGCSPGTPKTKTDSPGAVRFEKQLLVDVSVVFIR
jgi:hypothetical protein